MPDYVFSVEYFFSVFPKIIVHIDTTLLLTLMSSVFAFIIGCILAAICYYRVKILHPIARIYISFMRSTPLIAVLYLFYYGLAKVSVFVMSMSALTATALVLSLNMGAFMAETMRGAMLSVDEGQKEAAASLGMTSIQTVIRIVLPQAFRVAVPILFNDFINLLKLSALSFMVGVKDIMGAAKAEGAISFRFLEVYTAVVIIYWVMVSIFGIFHKKLERFCQNAY